MIDSDLARPDIAAEIVRFRRQLASLEQMAGLPSQQANPITGFRLVNPGEVVQADDHNLAMTPASIHATAAARNAAITAPVEGMQTYLQDVDAMQLYDGVAWVGVPKGRLGYARNTSLSQTMTTWTDLTGLSVTVTLPAGRLIRVQGRCNVQSSAGSTIQGLLILQQVGGQAGACLGLTSPTVNLGITLNATTLLTPSAGSQTYRLQGGPAVGGGTSTFLGTIAEPAFLLVEDVGAA